MSKLRILLVDDEPAILQALRRVLRQCPELVLECFSDPAAALDRARECSFALAIADYRMPGLNGAALLGQLRRLQPDCARLILSGDTDRQGLMQAINEAHIARFIAKPWAERELLDSVQQQLQRRAERLEERALAEQQRLLLGQLSAQELELARLERLEPGLTFVPRSSDGAYLLDWRDTGRVGP